MDIIVYEHIAKIYETKQINDVSENNIITINYSSNDDKILEHDNITFNKIMYGLSKMDDYEEMNMNVIINNYIEIEYSKYKDETENKIRMSLNFFFNYSIVSEEKVEAKYLEMINYAIQKYRNLKIPCIVLKLYFDNVIRYKTFHMVYNKDKKDSDKID